MSGKFPLLNPLMKDPAALPDTDAQEIRQFFSVRRPRSLKVCLNHLILMMGRNNIICQIVDRTNTHQRSAGSHSPQALVCLRCGEVKCMDQVLPRKLLLLLCQLKDLLATSGMLPVS